MLKSWRLARFKSIAAPVEVKLAPLTILCGANSSGKSSLLQSMLFLSQSCLPRASGSPLILNGVDVRLGTYQDVAHGRTARTFNVGFDFETQVQETHVTQTARARNRLAEPRRYSVLLRTDVSVAPGTGRADTNLKIDELEFAASSSSGHATRLSIKHRRGPSSRFAMPSGGTPSVLGSEDFVLRLRSEHEAPVDPIEARAQTSESQLAGVELQGFVPTAFRYPIDPLLRDLRILINDFLIGAPASYVRSTLTRLQGTQVEEMLIAFMRLPAVVKLIGRRVESATDSATAFHSLTGAQRGTLQKLLPAFVATLPGRDARVIFERQRLPAWLAPATQRLLGELASIKHVGPLREPPRALHELSATGDPLDVGDRGQYTAAVLHQNASRKVTYMVDETVQAESLQVAVDYWLRSLGVHSAARTHDLGKLGHQLGIRDEAVSGELDLTQVGVGVSQLLPLVVQTLLTPVGGILLLEQPELHLNPAVQSRLADFLASASRVGKQIICETHSEHLVNRLRILAGEGKLAPDEQFRILFVRRRSGATTFAPIELDSHGRIRNWPEGFFDQTLVDAARLLELDLSSL